MKTIEWLKKNSLQLILIISFVLFGLYTCNKDGKDSNLKADTVYSSHTEYIPQPVQYVPQYTPQPSSSIQPIIIPPQYAPNTANLEALLKQYNSLLEKHIAQNRYLDSIPLKDSTGRRVGVVNLDDLVSENQIKSRRPSYQLIFPVTTNEMKITQPAKPKDKFYIGAAIQGGKTNIFNQAGLGFLYQSKKDAVWGIKVNYNFQGNLNYELNRYWKLSFKK